MHLNLELLDLEGLDGVKQVLDLVNWRVPQLVVQLIGEFVKLLLLFLALMHFTGSFPDLCDIKQSVLWQKPVHLPC